MTKLPAFEKLLQSTNVRMQATYSLQQLGLSDQANGELREISKLIQSYLAYIQTGKAAKEEEKLQKNLEDEKKEEERERMGLPRWDGSL